MDKKVRDEKSAFEMLGGIKGARALANTFYEIINSLPEAKKIRDMHPTELKQTSEKFALFLSGWLGGPPLYKEKYGTLDLTGLHALLKIGEAERDMWLSCMEKALEQQEIEEEFKIYLLGRFRVPAEKIYGWCRQQTPQPFKPEQLKDTI